LPVAYTYTAYLTGGCAGGYICTYHDDNDSYCQKFWTAGIITAMVVSSLIAAIIIAMLCYHGIKK
jgi:hypothetical protein